MIRVHYWRDHHHQQLSRWAEISQICPLHIIVNSAHFHCHSGFAASRTEESTDWIGCLCLCCVSMLFSLWCCKIDAGRHSESKWTQLCRMWWCGKHRKLKIDRVRWSCLVPWRDVPCSMGGKIITVHRGSPPHFFVWHGHIVHRQRWWILLWLRSSTKHTRNTLDRSKRSVRWHCVQITIN